MRLMHALSVMLKAFFTTVLLASSSVAVADTQYNHDHRDDYGHRKPDVRTEQDDRQDLGHRFDRRADWRRHPVSLANNVVLTSRDRKPVWVAIDRRAHPSRLQVQLQGGRAYIDHVVLVFADGSRETVPVNEVLTWKDRWVTIDVPQHGDVTGVFIDAAAPQRSARGAGSRGRVQRGTVQVIGLRR